LYPQEYKKEKFAVNQNGITGFGVRLWCEGDAHRKRFL